MNESTELSLTGMLCKGRQNEVTSPGSGPVNPPFAGASAASLSLLLGENSHSLLSPLLFLLTSLALFMKGGCEQGWLVPQEDPEQVSSHLRGQATDYLAPGPSQL